MTRPETLSWSMLKWKFDVERVGVTLGHNVEYTGSMSRLPILVLECSKGGHQEECHAKQDWKVAFWGGKSGWNSLKFSCDNPSLQANHFHIVASPRSFSTMYRHAKTPCLGWEVARFSEAAKREWWGDNLTGKQNMSTVGTSRFVLVSAIFTPFAGAECWSSVQSSTACQSRSLVSENAAVPSLHVPIAVDEFCLPVKVLPHQQHTYCSTIWTPVGLDCTRD